MIAGEYMESDARKGWEQTIFKSDIAGISIITEGITFPCGKLLHNISVASEVVGYKTSTFSGKQFPVYIFHVVVPFDLYDEKNNQILYVSDITKKASRRFEEPPHVSLYLRLNDGNQYSFLNGLIEEENLKFDGEDYYLKFLFDNVKWKNVSDEMV